ncbi:MAG: hypothetical protein PHV85_02355 [Desulfovibrionaceae bacterium]|nr:hypothetical protein [Desulfovibrionaceae bacterium]
MFKALWWTAFVLAGIWAQSFLPGVDLLAAGLVVCLQDEDWLAALWLGLALIFVQEGVGSLAFGYSILWYGGLGLLYFLGRRAFEPESVLFMCLLGAGLGLLHVLCAMASGLLQGIELPLRRLALEAVLQAAVFPVEWLALGRVFPDRLRRHEHFL